MKWTRHAITLAIAVTSAVWLHAQQPASGQLPVFRAGTNLVHVDVFPRRDGRVVEDLTPADFEIFEDGKPQKVEAFQFVAAQPWTPDAERRDPNSAAEGRALAADPFSKVFVVFFDTYHIGNSAGRYRTQPVLDTLSRLISPTDVFAVLTQRDNARDLAFGRQFTTLEAMLNRVWDWGQADSLRREPDEQGLEYCLGAGKVGPVQEEMLSRQREDFVLTKLRDLVRVLGAVRQERTSVLLFSEGWPLHRPNPAIVEQYAAAYPPRHAPEVYVGPDGKMEVDSSLKAGSATACQAEMQRLAGLDDARAFRSLLDEANRANVTFDPIDPASLTSFSDRRQDAIYALAFNTDGVAVVADADFDAGMKRIVAEQGTFYLLGYYSTNTAPDGGYRRIEVRVKPRDIKVVARRGYTAPSAAEMARRAAPATARPSDDGGAALMREALGALARLRSSAEVFTYTAASLQSSLIVEVELASRVAMSAPWTGGAAVQADVVGANGEPAGQGRGRIEAGARGTLIRVPLVATVAGPWTVRVRLKGDATGALLDDSVDARSGSSTILGAAAIFRAASLRGAPIVPAADFQFRRTERMRIEWPATGPLDQRLARLLDRAGQPLPIEVVLSEHDDAAGHILAADVSFAALAPGDYVIEVTTTRAGKTEKKLVAIRVEA